VDASAGDLRAARLTGRM